MTEATPTHAQLREHAGALRLHGLLAHWAEVMGDPQQEMMTMPEWLSPACARINLMEMEA